MNEKTLGGTGDGARDGACTPKWLADVIGRVDLDPCSNPRSHIQAGLKLTLENGDDGLREDKGPGHYHVNAGKYLVYSMVGLDSVVFVNPPYSRGQVIRWVRHYKHTRFIFLLRWDPRTKWFNELIDESTHVWFPRETGAIDGIEPHPARIEFEPPPGVTFSSNPFPHALYMAAPSVELQRRLRQHGRILCQI